MQARCKRLKQIAGHESRHDDTLQTGCSTNLVFLFCKGRLSVAFILYFHNNPLYNHKVMHSSLILVPEQDTGAVRRECLAQGHLTSSFSLQEECCSFNFSIRLSQLVHKIKLVMAEFSYHSHICTVFSVLQV